MSVIYPAVSWNKHKKNYDLILGGFILFYCFVFISFNLYLFPGISQETLIIRTTATLAFLLLNSILAIGPLCRLDSRFLPLLYNRRHLGVTMFGIAAIHGIFSILQFHSLGNINPILSVFQSNVHYNSITNFPFQVLGFFALIILMLMAFTSHDFWLNILSPRIWKMLHMSVYIAYSLIVMHIALGVIQLEAYPGYFVLIALAAILLIVLHVLAGIRQKRKDTLPNELELSGYYQVGRVNEIEEGRAKAVFVNNVNIAIFRYGNLLSAVSNVCKHQNGPIGEGKVIDGCITCPWHGYQYRPRDGAAPAPFKEKLATYRIKLLDGFIYVDPNGLPEGTAIEPIIINNSGEEVKEENSFYVGYLPVPLPVKKRIRFVLGIGLVAFFSLAAFLVMHQRYLQTGTFEYGKRTNLKGVLVNNPIPMLLVKSENDLKSSDYLSAIPLVGSGKHGAEASIEQFSKKYAAEPYNHEIVLEGTLIFRDGKTLMEVANSEKPILEIGSSINMNTFQLGKTLGSVDLTGEIIDPKCYFGVMNPGLGKPHRSCAVRCISGGIPPVFHVRNKAGESGYYLLRGEHGEAINQQVLDYIAEPVTIHGNLKQYLDWMVIEMKDIKRN